MCLDLLENGSLDTKYVTIHEKKKNLQQRRTRNISVWVAYFLIPPLK